MSYNPLKLDGIELINIFNKDGEQTLATGGDQGIIVTGPSTINSSLTVNPGNNRIKFWEGGNSIAQIGLRDSSTNEVFLQGWGSDFRVAVGGTYNNHALIIDNAKNTKLYGDLIMNNDGNEFWIKSTDYNIARIIPRGSSGANLDKGLFSLIASDGTNNNVEKVRIDSAGGSWFDGGSFRLGAGDFSIEKNTPVVNLGVSNTSTGNARINFFSKNGTAANAFAIEFNKTATLDRLEFIDGSGTANVKFYNGGTIELVDNLKATGNNLKFHAGGNHILNIDLNGKVYPATDNSVDLGFSDSAYRFRNLYLTNTADIPSMYLHDYIYHKGDTDTYIKFSTDLITLRANAKDILHLGFHGGVSTNNTGTNVGQFAYAPDGLIADNLGGANMIRKGTDIAVQGSGNYREEVTFIDGTKVQAHTSTGNGTNTNCYQWYTSENIKVNPEKDYEYSVWVKSTGDDHLYLGWHEYASNGNRLTSNPYFHTNKIKTHANGNNTGTVVANINGWTKLTFKLKSHRTTSGQADSVADRYASNNRTQASGISGVTGVMHSTTSLVHLRLGTCYGSVNNSKSYFYNPKITEAQDDDYKFDLNVGEWSNISDLSISNLLTVGPGTTGSPYDSTTFLHVKGTTRSIVQQSSTADAYYMFGDAGANNAAWLGYNHSSGVLDLHSETSILLDKGTTIQGTLSVTGTNVTVSNATNPYIYLNDTNAGAALFQQEGNDTRIGSDSNTTVKIIQNNQDAVTIDTSKNATFVGALDIRGSGYNQIKIANNLTANANKQSGIVTENYEGNNVSILQTFQQNNINSIYYGSADSSYAGVQNHYFYVNTDSDTATSGHTKAFQIKSDLASTFYGSLTITGATTFNSSAAIPSASSHLLIGSGIQTTGKIKFGSTSWSNNIGLESYWMVLGCNQNEGFKFRSSTGTMLMQINGNNNSLTASDNMQAGPNSVVFNNIAVAKSKFYDYDAISPNQNLLDIASIKIASHNDQYGNATKTTISPYVARYTNDNTGGTTVRLYVDDNQLIDGDNYMVSVYYEDLIGTLSVDFCDVSVTGNGSQVGTSSAPKSGRIYGYASRSDYNSTYRFFDISLNQGSGHAVTLHSPKVEAGTLLTDFVATERVNMPTNSNHVRDLVASNTITTYGNAAFHHGSTTHKTIFGSGNEINTFTAAGGAATQYLNWQSGAVNIAKALVVQHGTTGSAAFGGTVTAKNTTITTNVGSGTAEVLTVNHGAGSHTGIGIQVNSANSGHALNITGSVGSGYLRITSAYNSNPTISLSGGIIAGGTITAGDITGAELTSKHAAAPVLKLRREDTSIIEGNSIGAIYFQGDDPSATNTGAAILGVAAGTWNMGSPNVYPSKLVFQTAKQNALIMALTIDEDQDSVFNGKIVARSNTGVGDIYLGNKHTGNYARFHTNNSNTYFDMNCGVVYWRQGSSTRFQHNMTSGTFTSSGDIIAYGSPSDVRLKENIKPIESALAKVDKLQGVTFDWKDSESILEIKEDIGFIAQDVQKVLPELVRENENGMLSMRHQGITPILLEAIKELKAEIEELKKQIK